MQIKEVRIMGMYDSRIVYPPEFDEIEPCPIEDCPFGHGICADLGFCLFEEK